MPHLDLYATYGLDRSRDPATLAAELDRRIGTSWGDDAEQVNGLRIARAVLGDAGRRVRYDRQLDDPSAPPITMADLETLASMPGSGGGSGSGGGFGDGFGTGTGGTGGTGADDGETAVLPVGGNPYAPTAPAGPAGSAGPVGPGSGFYGQTGPTGPTGFTGQTGGPGGPGVPGYGANPYAPTGGAAPAGGTGAASSSPRWILPAVLGVVVVAGIAVAGTWFVMRDDGDSSAAPVAGFTSAPAAPTQDDATGEATDEDDHGSPLQSSEAADPFDHLFDDDFLDDDSGNIFGEVSITGATATSTTCDGRACDRIEITLTGDGEPKIIDGYTDGELQIDIYGVEVAYQSSFPVTDHTDGHHGYITDGVDEYGWPRLRIGASEGTDYTVDNDYTNHHIIVEVYG